MALKQFKGYKITQRTDGRWHSRVTQNGQRKSIYGQTQSECYNNLKAYLKDNVIQQRQELTLQEYYDKWFEIYKKPVVVKPTQNTIKSIFKKHILPKFGKIKLSKIQTIDVNAFINSTKSNRVKEYVSQYLIAILRQAYLDKIMREDITANIIKYHSKRQEGKALDFEQRKTFLEKCEEIKHGDIFKFYYYSGARLKEGLNFAPTDIFPSTIRIPGTKTDKSDRVIPKFKPLLILLDSVKIDKRKATVFQTSETIVKRELIKLTELCKFKFTVKDLRTTFGTMCAEMGIPDTVIAKWMGHSTTQTTKKYYIKIQSKFEQEQIDIFDTNFDTNLKAETQENTKK